jgi:hypothetical protein
LVSLEGRHVKKTMLPVTMLIMALAATVPALATSWAYGSCADIPTQVEAQQILDDPNYGYDPGLPPPQGPPVDFFNLDPDGDGVACNDEGNFTAENANEPGVCLEGQAAVVCPEGSIVVRYGEDGRVYDELGNEYVFRCVGPHIPNTYQPCEWVPAALPMEPPDMPPSN